MSDISDQEWEQIQARLDGHFMQSAAWARFQRALGRDLLRWAGDGWSCQGVLVRNFGVTHLFCPYGPTLGANGKLEQVVAAWRADERLRRVTFVRLEPTGAVSAAELRALGARRAREVSPERTLVVDLTLPEEQLRHELTSGHRNAINAAERRGLSFRRGSAAENLAELLGFLRATGQRNDFRNYPDEYYRTLLGQLEPGGEAKLFVAEHEGRTVAAAIVFDYDGARHYAYSAGDVTSRQLQAMAPFVWYLMMDARASGMKKFDLWGILPDNAPAGHSWAGFTKFKRAFGGAPREYHGTWELPLRPAAYAAYRLAHGARRLTGTARRLAQGARRGGR